MKKHLLIIAGLLLLAGCAQNSKQKPFTEEQALTFLYQYMPLGDRVDYTEDYYRECIGYAFRAKEELPWGPSVPEREFKHFVLPVRVNNENLDRFRATYYEELRDRVEDLSMYDAVLEVNHWCHEHVNYKGSDSRTSAPMATIKTSWGRCGEESTLLVTALRTVGIPARQVYTPRWAHCDDNHAWVEAWVDGSWHFLGACEPEPVLDLGWFNEPASRTLLLHTRVFGDYDGPEEVISRTPYFTEINVVDNYGQTAKTTFTVTDAQGKPQAGINVEFKIYNYAEFCTVVTKTTDAQGQTSLTSGLGTMMAYACRNGKFGFAVFKAGMDEEVGIVLNHQPSDLMSFEFDMVPPAPTANLPEVTPEMRAENDRRFHFEDSLRNAYVAECQQHQVFKNAWGNWQTIADFLSYAKAQGREAEAVQLLESLSDKDLRDITLEVLKDHFDAGLATANFSPRISNEMIVAWRHTLSTFFDEKETEMYRNDPQLLVDWVRDNIAVNDSLNPQRIPISPLGVLETRQADRHSRDIFFVALARSLGIPSQINPVNGNVEVFADGQPTKIDFEAAEPVSNAVGYLDLQYQHPIASVADPKYYTHFSLKRFDGQSFRLLAYDAKDPGIDDGMLLSTFEHPLPLDEGYYVLTTGTRLKDGTALTHSEFFNIEAGQTTTLELVLREPRIEVEVLGQLDFRPDFVDTEGVYILGLLDQGSEPTTHALVDIEPYKKEFEAMGVPMYLVTESEQGQWLPKLTEALGLDKTTLPLFVIVNERNEAVFVKQGYTIGMGEQLYHSLRAISFSV